MEGTLLWEIGIESVFGLAEDSERRNVSGARAFISYSHEDQEAARRIATWLSDRGATPIWDEQLQPGTRFREGLVTFIGNVHVFVALLTEASIKRPWVLQEMGYAAALGIPIVPISAGPLPQGLIGDLHALRVGSDWLDLEQRLPAVKWLALKDTQLREPNTVLATLARSSSDRVKLLVTFASRVLSLGGTGLLRQRAGLSTFCIPDAPVMHKVWIEHDGPARRNDEHHEQQRQERRIFESQARTEGCKLIIDPHIPFADPKSKKGRLSRLRAFLADPRTDERIQAITHTREFSGNMTIFGD